MQDLMSMIAGLKRPKLLTRAARAGLPHYRRALHLRMALNVSEPPRHAVALMQLLELEAEQNALRKAHDANYAPARHVSLLVAMLGELNAMRIAQG